MAVQEGNEKEQVINELEKQIRITESVDSGWVHLTIEKAKKALELLKEQEPVKPKRDNTGVLCGRCGQWIGTNDRFCSNCGTEVKWDVAD